MFSWIEQLLLITYITYVLCDGLEYEKCSDPDKIYHGCQSSSCVPKCSNPFPGPVCTADCISGCFCRQDLYLDEKTNKCRTLEQCYDCKGNSHFTRCGTCDGTCEEPGPICAQYCRIGCFCKNGDVRLHGVCIPQDACPKHSDTSSETSSESD